MAASADDYRPELDERPNSALNRTQLRARFEYRKSAAKKFAEAPSWVNPIPLLYSELAVTALIDIGTQIHHAAEEIETVTAVRAMLETDADRDRMTAELTTMTRALARLRSTQTRLRKHFADQFAEGKSLTLPEKPAKKPRKAAPRKVSDKSAARKEARRVVTEAEADKLIAEKWAAYESAHAVWKLTRDEHGPGILTDMEAERHFAQLAADTRAARDLYLTVPATPAARKTAAKLTRDRAIQREVRHKRALEAQRKKGEPGFVIPGRKTTAEEHPAVNRARDKADELYILAHNFESAIRHQRIRNTNDPDAVLKIPAKRAKKAKPKSARTGKAMRNGRGGFLPPLPTPESKAKGSKTRQIKGSTKLLWVPVIMYPTLPADVVLARNLMTLSNPDFENQPSYVDGDRFFTFWLTHTFKMPLAWKTAINHGIAAEYREAKDRAWREASLAKLEKYGYQRDYAPKIAASLPESLPWHVVQIAGSTKWVVSERHVPRLLETLAAAEFPFRVIEFNGLPVFATYKPNTPGVKGRRGTPPKADPNTVKGIPPRLIEPDEIGPRTELGNPSSVGMTEAKILEVLHPKKGIARLRYAPGTAALSKTADYVAERVADLSARPVEDFMKAPAPKPEPVAPSTPEPSWAEVLDQPTPTLPPTAETSHP